MEKARRRRVPAFGEWNYYYYSGELATPAAAAVPSEWYAAAPELDARSDVWFKYPEPPRKPPPRSRKVRRPEKMDKSYSGGGGKPPRATMPASARASDAVALSSSAARTPAKSAGAARARVAPPVDADLYQAVPPPDFVHDDDLRLRPRRQHHHKKASRSLWTGCFGIGCIPTE